MIRGQEYATKITNVRRKDGTTVKVQHRADVSPAVVQSFAEVPSLQDDVAAERANYGPTMTVDECVELCNTVAWDNRDDSWGVNAKASGALGTRYDGTTCAIDILHHKATDVLVDCLAAAGEASTPTWIVHGVNPAPSTRPWVAPIVPQDSQGEGGATGTPIDTAVGVSFFCALALRSVDRARYDHEIAWHRDVLKARYARIFWWLDDPPWATVGTAWMSDTQRQAALRDTMMDLLAAGIRPQVTVFGSAVRDSGRRQQLVAQCAEVLQAFARDLWLVDLVNEPIAIGFQADDRSPYAEVREVTRQLASYGLPLRALSPASPNSLHAGVDDGYGGRREATDAEIAADVEKLMGGLPVNVNALTPHWGRAPWKPHRPLGPYAAGLLIINDEPRGIESSVSWISQPAEFAADLLASAEAGDDSYCFHGEPGVWHGYCDTSSNASWAHNNSLPTWDAIDNIDAIVAALDEVRQTGGLTAQGGGGSGSGGGGGVPPDAGDLMKTREQFYTEFQDINAFYVAQLGLQRPGGMVVDWEGDPHKADVQAMGAWGYDLMSGRTPDQIKHDICASGEWQAKHPGESPPY